MVSNIVCPFLHKRFGKPLRSQDSSEKRVKENNKSTELYFGQDYVHAVFLFISLILMFILHVLICHILQSLYSIRTDIVSAYVNTYIYIREGSAEYLLKPHVVVAHMHSGKRDTVCMEEILCHLRFIKLCERYKVGLYQL